MSVAHRVIKNTGFLYAKMGITMFISLYTTRLVLNSLGAEDFGIFNVVAGVIAMLGFLSASLSSTTQRFMSYAEGGGGRAYSQINIFNVSIVLHAVIALIAGLILLIIGYILFNGVLNINEKRIVAAKIVYIFSIVSMIFTVVSVPFDAVFNARENMLFFSLIGIIESLLKLGAALLINESIKSDKLILYGLIITFIPIINLVIKSLYCTLYYNECRILPLKYWDSQLSKEMTTFASWDFLTSTSSMVGQYGISVVLNHYWGTKVNASQGISTQISGQLMAFSTTMLKALNPTIVKSVGSGNHKLAIQSVLLGSKYSFFLTSIFCIPFLIETDYILKLWLKNTPNWAVIFCQLQLVRVIIEQLTVNLRVYIYAVGDIKTYVKIKSAVYLMPIIVSIVLFEFNFPPYIIYYLWIVFWGLIGGFILLYFAVKKKYITFKEFLLKVIYPCFSFFILTYFISIIPIYFLKNGGLRFVVVVAISLIVIIFSFWTFGMSKYEKEKTTQILRKKFKKIESYC